MLFAERLFRIASLIIITSLHKVEPYKLPKLINFGNLGGQVKLIMVNCALEK